MFTGTVSTASYDWTGAVPTESVWNATALTATAIAAARRNDPDGAGGGSGGGLSMDFPMPSYQQNAVSLAWGDQLRVRGSVGLRCHVLP